jgi:hypothetical protein
MLFEFHLRPLDKIEPWGTVPDLSLSWFGLTDSDYRINVGSEQLFVISEAAMKRLRAKYPDFRGDWVDYYAVRLWEDLFEILPDVFAPIPERFADRLSEPDLSLLDWMSKAFSWWQSLDDAALDAEESDYLKAVEWLGRRKLDSLYLTEGPNIWFWSTPENVIITWDNRGLMVDAVPRWSASSGSFTLPREAFLQEVRDFNARLIDQMRGRVEDVCSSWSRPEIRIDFEQLRAEHGQRALFLDETLARTAHPENWEDVNDSFDRLDLKIARRTAAPL